MKSTADAASVSLETMYASLTR